MAELHTAEMQSISNNDSNSDTSDRSSASEDIQVFKELEEEEEEFYMLDLSCMSQTLIRMQTMCPDNLTWNGDKTHRQYWCTCGKCQQMPTAVECVCCHEIQEVVTVRRQGEEHFNQVLYCITDHPGLNAVCLDPYGLQVAWMTYKQQYKGKAFDGPQDAKYRHLPTDNWCAGAGSFLVRTTVLCSQHVPCLVSGHIFHHQKRSQLYSKGFVFHREMFQNCDLDWF
ncbi:uncharacterized protein LOC109529260 [Hippocampus comes]|uniref:uncharacterized protein LOC109529260 n=1 Tax=Hippocampus comes TaxID=109280 RepID=UPI00094E3FF0|nr:PREDICTED: uncharacterized protein LOC109529260 [Hippocampus comes]